jgi:hypothetical protein
MADAAPTTNHEFWQPPAIAPRAEAVEEIYVPAQADACPRCQTEFMVGARFCHACGCSRPRRDAKLSWTRYLEFHNIKQGAIVVREALGLPLPPLVCFLVGMVCLAGALLVGFVVPSDSVVDFQAIQYWRMEWLLGAVAAFMAGILLKLACPPQK